MSKPELNERMDEMLSSPIYTELLLCIASGKNYASSIARFLGKRQSTVTEQLKELEGAGLIESRRNGATVKYYIKWGLLAKHARLFIRDILKERGEHYSPDKIKKLKENLAVILPTSFLRSFFKEYSKHLSTVGGVKKSFTELILAMLYAILQLDKAKFEALAKRFNINPRDLSDLASIVGIETHVVELSALDWLAERGDDENG